MDTKSKFLKWLEVNSGISENTIYKYVRAVGTMSNDISKHKKINIDIYNVKIPKEIDSIKNIYLDIDELRDKDKRGNRMYTSALKWYKKFLEAEKENANYIDKLSKEKEEYVFEESSTYGLKYEKKIKGKHYIKEGQKYWKRDRKVVNNVLKEMDYTCEENKEHCYFKSKATGENYVEGHHLVPMEFQDDFECSLDVEANVVSLCVVCHKKLHLASIEDKKEILEKLYKSREANLKKSGIQITLQELINLYSKE